MEDDLESSPEAHPKRLQLNAREQKLFAYVIRLSGLVCILLLAKWLI